LIKKIYRIVSKKFALIFYNQLSKIFEKFDYKIIPNLNNLNNYKSFYSKHTRRLIFKPKKEFISKITIDTSNYHSKLCDMGAKYETNKSQYNLNHHRTSFTTFYDILFSSFKDKKFNFAEIGIENNSSIKMWRKYFSKSNIYGLEYYLEKINKAKQDKLKNTFYKLIDVSKKEDIANTFKSINKTFDIIIDDSTHIVNHQINIIEKVYPYLSKNGILIIEDINRKNSKLTEREYFIKLKKFRKFFQNIYFVEFFNTNMFTANAKCEKILVLIKN